MQKQSKNWPGVQYPLNTKVAKILGTPVGGQGGFLMDPNSENTFPEGVF